MKRKLFADRRPALAQRQAVFGTSTEGACRRPGISGPAFYRRTRQFAGLAVAETRRPRQLEEEDRKPELLDLDPNQVKTKAQHGLSRM